MGRGVPVQVSNQANHPRRKERGSKGDPHRQVGTAQDGYASTNVAINPSQRAKTLPAAGTELIRLTPPTTLVTRIRVISYGFQSIYIPIKTDPGMV